MNKITDKIIQKKKKGERKRNMEKAKQIKSRKY